jgi:hypothetical protein
MASSVMSLVPFQKGDAFCPLEWPKRPLGNKAWILYPISDNFPRIFAKILALRVFSRATTMRKALVL